MKSRTTEITIKLSCDNSNDVFITIKSDDGNNKPQAETSTIIVDGKPVTFGEDIHYYNLGQYQNLQNKEIKITSYVTDISLNSNSVNIEYLLSCFDDREIYKTKLYDKVINDTDTFKYVTIIHVD